MGMVLTIAAIFAGIGVFMATMYSVSQILLLEGRARMAHVASVVTILIVMACLMERWNDTARIAAIPMLAAAFWTLVVEPRWYRVFPILVVAWAILIIMGYVVLA